MKARLQEEVRLVEIAQGTMVRYTEMGVFSAVAGKVHGQQQLARDLEVERAVMGQRCQPQRPSGITLVNLGCATERLLW